MSEERWRGTVVGLQLLCLATAGLGYWRLDGGLTRNMVAIRTLNDQEDAIRALTAELETHRALTAGRFADVLVRLDRLEKAVIALRQAR